MKRYQRWAVLGLCACLLVAGSSCNNEKKTAKKETESVVQNDADGQGGSDFWEVPAGVTVPPDVAPDETPQEVADEFLSALRSGDWDTVNKRLLSYSLTGNGMSGMPKDGIMYKIMTSMEVRHQAITDNGDGTHTVSMTVEAIDYRALVKALPEGIASKEEAREEMLRLANHAQRSEFDATLTVLRYSETGPYFIEPDVSFVNALTGGYYEFYVEIAEGVATA